MSAREVLIQATKTRSGCGCMGSQHSIGVTAPTATPSRCGSKRATCSKCAKSIAGQDKAPQKPNKSPVSIPKAFTGGDWVDVQVLERTGKFTGSYARAKIAAVRPDGRFDLVDVRGKRVQPALSSGIRSCHLRHVTKATSHEMTKASAEFAALKDAELQLEAAEKTAKVVAAHQQNEL